MARGSNKHRSRLQRNVGNRESVSWWSSSDLVLLAAQDRLMHPPLPTKIGSTTHEEYTVQSLGDGPEMARELVVRELFALEEYLGHSHARTKCDLRSGEVACAKRQAHRALQIDVQVLPALSYIQRKEGTVTADVGNAPGIAFASARRGWRWWGLRVRFFANYSTRLSPECVCRRVVRALARRSHSHVSRMAKMVQTWEVNGTVHSCLFQCRSSFPYRAQ